MMIGPEPMMRIFLRSVRFGIARDQPSKGRARKISPSSYRETGALQEESAAIHRRAGWSLTCRPWKQTPHERGDDRHHGELSLAIGSFSGKSEKCWPVVPNTVCPT